MLGWEELVVAVAARYSSFWLWGNGSARGDPMIVLGLDADMLHGYFDHVVVQQPITGRSRQYGA
ncbi:MAG: hypothetical protein O2782_23240 [bacterium]|nr:hypothetical protein [bacterium]